MFKQKVIPFLYCIFFPLLIGIVLFAIPEFSSLANDKATPLARLMRALMTLWLMFGYIVTGISFIPNLESSPIALFNTWGKYYNLRDKNHEPRVDRIFFPAYYFLPTLISCAFTSLVFLIAISTFAKPSPSLTVSIATVNFLLLFLPRVVLYSQASRVLYGDEP